MPIKKAVGNADDHTIMRIKTMCQTQIACVRIARRDFRPRTVRGNSPQKEMTLDCHAL